MLQAWHSAWYTAAAMTTLWRCPGHPEAVQGPLLAFHRSHHFWFTALDSVCLLLAGPWRQPGVEVLSPSDQAGLGRGGESCQVS